MITLRLMQAEEFPSYRDYFVVDYADEIAANYGYTLEKSRSIAIQELLDDLPQTVDTPDHYLLCIENDNDGLLGYLWYKLFDNGKTAFIYDFVVSKEFRGMGYGKAALIALEKQLFQSSVEQIKLRVAFENSRALSLYKKLEFNITGYNMIKILK